MFGKFNRWWNHFSPHYLGPNENIVYPDRSMTTAQMRFHIRQAHIEDIDTLVDIEQQVYLSTPWNQAAFASDLVRSRDRLYLIISHENENVAYVGSSISWLQYDMHITNIGVIPEYQDLGLGTMMLDELKAVAKNNGLKTMSLEVRRSNIGAQRLYNKIGFFSTGINPDYYIEDHEDAVDMKLNLQDEEN